VFYNKKFLKGLLDVIITIVVILLILNMIAIWGSAIIRASGWNYMYNIIKHLQVTGFCIIEFCLLSLYI
jgi:hypothetical protein